MASRLITDSALHALTIPNGIYNAPNSTAPTQKSSVGLMNGTTQSPVSSSAGSTDIANTGPVTISTPFMNVDASGDANHKNNLKNSARKGRADTAPPLDPQTKQVSSLIQRCVKELTRDDPEGASFENMLIWLKEIGAPEELTNDQGLDQAIEREIAYVKIKKLECGYYALAKKRGRPFGTGFLGGRRSSELPNPNDPRVDQSQSAVESSRPANTILPTSKKKKSTKQLMEGFVSPVSITPQIEQPASTSSSQRILPNPGDVPICDFCLRNASRNKRGEYEALLMCKDCPARAHPTCMTYTPILARRSAMSAWQCIDCKTCCLCLEAGDPDGLLFCDACDKGYHMTCHDPQLSEKPGNKWACAACLKDGVNLEDVVSEDSQKARSSENTNPRVINGEVGGQLPAAVTSWTPYHVKRYVLECGFKLEADKFLLEEIDGNSLLLLQRQDVLTTLSFKLGPALKIYQHIRALQSGSRYPPLK